MTSEKKMRQVTYSDKESGVEMTMDIVVDMDVEGKKYALLTPTAPMVTLLNRGPAGEEEPDAEAAADHIGEIEEVDDAMYKSLQPQLNAELAKWQVELKQTGNMWMLNKELPDEAFEDLEIIYLHQEDEHKHECGCQNHEQCGSDEEQEEEAEAYHLLAEVVKDGICYWMLMPIAPDLFAVEILGDRTRPLDDEEANKLVEKFQTAMEKLSQELGDEE